MKRRGASTGTRDALNLTHASTRDHGENLGFHWCHFHGDSSYGQALMAMSIGCAILCTCHIWAKVS